MSDETKPAAPATPAEPATPAPETPAAETTPATPAALASTAKPIYSPTATPVAGSPQPGPAQGIQSPTAGDFNALVLQKSIALKAYRIRLDAAKASEADLDSARRAWSIHIPVSGTERTGRAQPGGLARALPMPAGVGTEQAPAVLPSLDKLAQVHRANYLALARAAKAVDDAHTALQSALRAEGAA